MTNPGTQSYERDRIQVPPQGINNWSENLLMWAHDPESGLGIWTHMGRMGHNPEIWEGVAYVLLPGGEVLANRSMGVSRTQAAIGSEYLYTPVWPGQTWHFHFDGLAQRAKSADLSRHLIVNEPCESLAFELIFEGSHPIFDFSHQSMADQAWGTMHLEQGGTVRGSVRFGGKEFEVNCTGYRDHSAGPREYHELLTNEWVLCVLPSGRVFGSFHVTEVGNKNPMKSGFIFEDGKLSPLEAIEMPELHDFNGNPKEFNVQVLCDGKVRELSGKMRDTYIPLTLTLPTGIATGIDRDAATLPCSIEAPAIYNWDGEIGYGWIERIRRIGSLSQE